jgi:molybdate transport system regulatory protein
MSKREGKGRVSLRVKLWVEVEGRKGALSDAGADLLEQIEVCGSLSEAARKLGFAYRRAWLLVNAMNDAWGDKIVVTATGGKQGGGARVTDRGKALLRSYRDLQLRLEHLLDTASADFRD